MFTEELIVALRLELTRRREIQFVAGTRQRIRLFLFNNVCKLHSNPNHQ